MNGTSTALLLASFCVRVLAVLGSAALKASLIFAIVYLAARLLRKSHPARRHLLWCGAVFSYLMILLLSLIGPQLLPIHRPVPSDPNGLPRAVSTLLLSPRDAQAFVASGAGAASPAQAPPGQPGWALLLVLLWAAGMLVGLLQLVIGAARLRLLLAQARRKGPRPHARLARLCRKLSAAAGFRRTVRLVESPSCQVPFAAGVLHPLLVLPCSARAWPQKRLRAALLHELRHIRRLDALTQTASRLVCCLFWFVPLVWFANWFLYAEQEKACDSGALEGGVARRDYASCLLFAARLNPAPSAIAGLYSPLWRRRILEDRIRNVMTPSRATKRGWLVLIAAALAVGLLVLLGGASARSGPSKAELYQRFVGTWVNVASPGSPPRARVTVIRPDYIGEDKPLPAHSKTVNGRWAITVRKIWVDDRDNSYCQFLSSYFEGSVREFAALMRVSESGQVWELCCSEETALYPERIDPSFGACYAYARKK